MDNLTDELQSWEQVKEACDWSALLVGNGFSQNIWANFSYGSLFDTASNGDGARLSEQDISLFKRLETRNFEVVLSALSISKSVSSALGQNFDLIVEREDSIRNALVRAVHSVHIPWSRLNNDNFEYISKSLSEYSTIYCTNYDLLIYWFMMFDPKSFRDFFWSEEFDVANTGIWGKKTIVHFIHGGLHLYRRPNGQTLKRRAEPGQNLLDLFGTPYNDAVPLFISEGSAREKLASIYRSDYLSFVFARLAEDASPMVIFGSGLSEADKHIIGAVGARKGREIAVSLRAEGNIRQRKAALINLMPNARFHFFDAETHPLGVSDLSVAVEV